MWYSSSRLHTHEYVVYVCDKCGVQVEDYNANQSTSDYRTNTNTSIILNVTNSEDLTCHLFVEILISCD